MTATIRNYLATLCLQHVKATDPISLAVLKELAEENYKTGKPQWTSGYVYRKFTEIREKAIILPET